MPVYKYKAYFKNGKIVEGEKNYNTRDDLVKYLHEQGLIVTSVEEKLGFNIKSLGQFQLGKLSLKERLFFVKQMGAMLSAGLPIVQTLEIIMDQTVNASVRSKLEEVYKDIKGGLPLATSFDKKEFIFNDLQLSLLRAGEQSGNLVEIIKQIAVDMQKNHNLNGKIKGALIYPVMIMFTAIVVVIILVIYMIPAVVNLYNDIGAGEDKIPYITRLLVIISNFFSNPFGIIITIFIIFATIFGYKTLYSSVFGRKFIDKLLLKLPIFGDLINKNLILEMTRLLSMLIKSGISIVDALKATASSMNNIYYSQALLNTADEVSKGNSIAASLAISKVVPIMVIKMIATGEETGSLEQILGDLANFFEDEVNEITSNLTKLMEPLMLLIVGGMVGFLAIAVYLPIYSVANFL